MRRLSVLLLALACGLPPALARAAEPTPPDFQPDQRTVQRYGPAYRYPQAGWVVLHIEGEPYERGVQHGRLMAPEIAAELRCLAATHSPKAPTEGWKMMRTLVNSLFLRRYDKEYLEEMKGIADGATAAGARFDGRDVDVVDVVAINAWPEIMTLDEALDAEPTGLECFRCVENRPKTPVTPKPDHCSAFAAVGPATADGKIVFGHITMYSLYESSFFNVWLDVKSAKGHRVLMQSYPGGIQSGLDYYLNDAGILVSETTIAQTRFEARGLSVASRIRKALQYADSIDKAVEILKEENNGLYTNEWMLADVKTNEIAMFELGTKKSKLYRSSKNEWFGGTEGFYWGCNNTKDLDVRLETIDDVQSGRPGNAVFHPADRDRKWLELYDKYKGKIDVDFGKLAFTTAPIAAYHSVDAKFTTSDMAKELKTWALFGPPLGRTWQPTQDERENFSEIQPLVSNPWAVLTVAPPAADKPAGPVAVDLHDPEHGDALANGEKEERKTPETTPAWHGTLLPKADADVWLATAFRDYERIAALENAFRKRGDGKLTPEDRDALAVKLYAARADYNLGARAHPEASLNDTKSDLRQGDWYRVAAGKGVFLLHDLRGRIGAEKFDALMDRFAADHAGKPTSASEFQTFIVENSGLDGKAVDALIHAWRTTPGLPRLSLGKVRLDKVPDKAGGSHNWLDLDLHADSAAIDCPVEVVVETKDGEVTKRAKATASPNGSAQVEAGAEPLRVVVDKYNLAAKANGGAFTTLTFYAEPEQTLIVYGTGDELSTNREAADALQQAIRSRGSNVTVPIKSDHEVTDDDLKTHHLLLIGRPDCNKITARFVGELPVSFGRQSFVVRDETFAHADSAVIAAAENPLNRRYSMVVMAGLDAASTLRTAPRLMASSPEAAEVVLFAHGKPARSLTVPAKDLIREVEAVKAER